MWPVTDAFREAVRQSHKVVTRVDILNEGAAIGTLYPIEGSVSVDSRRAVRRTMSMMVVDEDGTLTPSQSATTGLLTPYGTELAVYRGVEYLDGSTELVPVGVFLLTEVTVTEDGNGEKINLQGSDRSLRISRNKLLDPYRIASGTSLESGLVALLRDRWVDVQTDFPATGITLPDVVIEADKGGDPWAACITIAEAFGYDLAFSPDGIARMQLIPDPVADDPVEVYQDGADAVITSLTRTFDSQRAYNAIVVTAQGTANATPFRVIAWDENPNSITYRYGAFGEVPFFYESSLITTAEQAAVTAAALLRKATGQSESVSWGQIVNPAHDVLDVIRLKRQAKSLDLVLLIDRLDLPLGPDGTMSAVARTQEVEV
jgi:hypothetical protein